MVASATGNELHEDEVKKFDVHGNVKVTTSGGLTFFSAEYTAVAGAISETLITPAAGERLGISSIFVSSESASGVISIELGSVIAYRAYPAKTVPVQSMNMHVEDGIDTTVTLVCTGLGATDRVFVAISYYPNHL